ncbi:MAG: MmcQ/YjbR family DNA-binding protein [Phycisphaerales bacterium]
MTEDQFRKLALGMPEAVEGSHMGHPDFRAGGPKGKIFATLFWLEEPEGDVDCAMVKLTPEEQGAFIKKLQRVFAPIKGAWGKQGCTQVRLDAVTKAGVPQVRRAIDAAWRNAAPKRLLDGIEPADGG